MWQIAWDAAALEDLKKLDRFQAKRIVQKVQDHLSQAPESLGKPLSASFAKLYRYRVGDYRVIYAIEQEVVTVRVIRVGHRKSVYE